jgi:hypothetical protein
MKTIALIILFFTFSIDVPAQLKKGHWMMGGTADFSHNRSESHFPGIDHESKSTTYSVAPGIGYFFIDRLCGGIRIDIGAIKSTENSESTSNPSGSSARTETKVSGWGLSPFLRYYFLPESRKVNLFADASYSFNDDKTKTSAWFREDNPPSMSESFSKTTYNSRSFSIAAGPVFFINSKVSFELSLGYIHRTAKKQDLKQNRILFGTGFQVYFGK